MPVSALQAKTFSTYAGGEPMGIGGLQHIFHEAAHGAGAIEGSLWSSQHFDALQIVRHQIEREGSPNAEAAARSDWRIIDVRPDLGRRADRGNAFQDQRALTGGITGSDIETRHV